MKYTSLKILKALTMASTSTRKAVGRIWGRVMDSSRRSHPAPSRLAYSYMASGTACRAAVKMTTLKPRFFQMYNSTMGTRSISPSSQNTRSAPRAATSRLITPP